MDTAQFKQRLQEKERDLLSDIARLQVEARGSGDVEVGDAVDYATTAQGTSQALQEVTLASETLEQVRAALQRIEDGSFGKCVVCGREIEPARLKAVPWTPYCLEDQEKRDRAAHVPGGSTL